MEYKKLKEKYIRNNPRKKQINKKTYIILICIWLMIFITIPFAVKANNINENSRENMFYVQVINNSMPIVKTTVFDEENIEKKQFSFRKEIMKLFGLDLNNSASMLNKEISCMSMDEDGQLVSKSKNKNDFNSFQLNDKSVSKNTKNDKISPKNNKVAKVYEPELKKELNKSKPEIFIYHTHSSESFKPDKQSSLDQTKNICAVGDALANQLEKNYGISVIHDKTMHDATAYTQSYQRSRVTVEKYLKKYKDFKLMIDLHRDAVENKAAVTVKLNGEDTAKFMFVMARKNPHFKSNMIHVNNMFKISNKLYPGFCRGVYYYDYGTNYFHQDKSNNALLIELGSHINTLTEAKNSVKYLARIIAEDINGKK